MKGKTKRDPSVRSCLAPEAVWTRSFDDFLGPHVVAASFGFDGRGDDCEIYWEAPFEDEPIAQLNDGYSIRICVDPDWQPATSVLCDQGGAFVGFYAEGMLWIDVEHRGKGLGAELVLALVERTGFVPSQTDGGLGYSAEGFHVHRKAWLLAGQRAVATGKEPHPDLIEELEGELGPAL